MRSMTGYSRLNYEDANYIINIEIKSVNNKNLNCKIKIPHILNFLESEIRNQISSKVIRGYLDIRIEFEDKRDEFINIEYDKNLLSSYLAVLSEIEKAGNGIIDNKIEYALKNFNIIKKKEPNFSQEEYSAIILAKLNEALNILIETKNTEGEFLKLFFKEKIDVIEKIVSNILMHKEDVVKNYKAKLLDRINLYKEDPLFCEEDILKELLIFSDKSDISEELSRVQSHMTQLKLDIDSKKPDIGKKLDFITQEIFRELNTTGVKSNMYEISKYVVDAKTELEKIREQVMNIE